MLHQPDCLLSNAWAFSERESGGYFFHFDLRRAFYIILRSSLIYSMTGRMTGKLKTGWRVISKGDSGSYSAWTAVTTGAPQVSAPFFFLMCVCVFINDLEEECMSFSRHRTEWLKGGAAIPKFSERLEEWACRHLLGNSTRTHAKSCFQDQ